MGQLTDMALVTQVVVFNNTKAFDTLVKKYQSPLRRFLLHQTMGDEALADDLAQDTFVKAYLSLASFRNLSSFQTWLFRIAYNLFYDHLRNQKAHVALDEASLADACAVQTPPLEHQTDIYQALQQLGTDERTCINLFYMEELSINKIVSITGMKSGTVKSHLSRGRAKMAAYLRKNGYE